ncbi:MAG TPA: magnesium/cobalt transporter CorA [Thermoanaerobaculia bacterium]|nr:magnesium/cobalt transporter CorA [Thermoanaerobaculia bacterium]
MPHRIFEKRHAQPGTAPGTLRAPEQRVDRVRIRVIRYSPESIEEIEVATVEECAAFRPAAGQAAGGGATWIDVVGLHDVELVARLGECFGLHPLALEDVVNLGQRPKADDYDDHLFCVLRNFHAGDASLVSEQISLFLVPGLLLTFQEMEGDSFEPVRERLRRGKGRIRRMGADYLAYALIDALVDQFFPILERQGERIEALEDELIEDPTPETLQKIYRMRRELLLLRRAAWPEREVLSTLQREETALMSREVRPFLRDAYDHSVQVLEILETYRELAGSMLDVYLSSLSHRMNEVMKVLTIIATIFIPLTFVAGIYGMNFDRMPELHWRWGYPVALVVMGATALALVAFFRRRGWF